MKNTSTPSWYSWLFIFVFFGIIIIPSKNLNFNPHQIDVFYGLGKLTNLATNTRVLMGDRVFPNVLIGEDGWLFYTAEKNMDDYQNIIPFSNEELARIQINLDALSKEYEAKGITLLVVIPPRKSSVYPEYMPEEIQVFGSESRLDQLITYLDENGHTSIMDFRPLLINAKNDRDVYYKTDTHWNEYSAYLAYKEITTELSKTYPAIQPHPFTDYKIIEHDIPLDLAKNIGASIFDEPKTTLQYQPKSYTDFREIKTGGRKIMFSSIPNPDLPTAIIYFDSFFLPVNPLLGEHFSQATYIQNYFGGGIWNLDWVEKNHPDIVIIEFTERYIHDLNHFIER